MTRLLALSSWVAHGHVGLSAIAPAVQALGGSVTQVPTCILSNHPGWPARAGGPVPVEEIGRLIDALEGNGWLGGIDTLLTGYLPTADHVALAADLARRLRRAAPHVRVVVDPVCGDTHTGLYLPEDTALALRERLVPLADTVTPNTFELGWLTQRPATTLDEIANAARVLSDGRDVVVTSVPTGPGQTGVLAQSGDARRLWAAPLLDGVPHGPGDVFAGLLAAGLPVAAALGHLNALVAASRGADHLRIAETASDWTAARPLSPLREL